MTSFAGQRTRMVERQLRRREITDGRVLAAMGEVPRELFVPAAMKAHAYDDAALSIGSAQTISQPWIVAAICQALELHGHEAVLEIGGGSGYSAAVLARLAARVISIELVADLAAEAQRVLALAGVPPERVEVIVADGSRGWAPGAPFEAIAVHAAAPGPPRSLLGQLADGGRLVAPVGGAKHEVLTLFRRDRGAPEGYRSEPIAPCRFVPLLGAEGFAAD
ncbi:MAG: protein-L-isoaspartate(D-aspartate) O-methyltransferase [Solirubrobacterales bacterium]